MTYTRITFDGHAVAPVSPISWPGGPAQLYMKRLPGNYRLPDDLMALLVPRERARLNRAARPEKVHRALRARCQLRLMLSDILGEAPQDVALLTNDEGRPGLHPRYGIPRDELDFSISYEPQGFVVCVAKGHRVGVDIQRFDQRQKDNFDQLFGSTVARERVTRLEVQELWTRMEAYGKLQGEGLGHGMQRLYQIAVDPRRADIPCRFYDFCFGLGTSVAVCLSGRPSAPLCLLN